MRARALLRRPRGGAAHLLDRWCRRGWWTLSSGGTHYLPRLPHLMLHLEKHLLLLLLLRVVSRGHALLPNGVGAHETWWSLRPLRARMNGSALLIESHWAMSLLTHGHIWHRRPHGWRACPHHVRGWVHGTSALGRSGSDTEPTLRRCFLLPKSELGLLSHFHLYLCRLRGCHLHLSRVGVLWMLRRMSVLLLGGSSELFKDGLLFGGEADVSHGHAAVWHVLVRGWDWVHRLLFSYNESRVQNRSTDIHSLDSLDKEQRRTDGCRGRICKRGGGEPGDITEIKGSDRRPDPRQ